MAHVVELVIEAARSSGDQLPPDIEDEVPAALFSGEHGSEKIGPAVLYLVHVGDQRIHASADAGDTVVVSLAFQQFQLLTQFVLCSRL